MIGGVVILVFGYYATHSLKKRSRCFARVLASKNKRWLRHCG
jgi:hypothetical protein